MSGVLPMAVKSPEPRQTKLCKSRGSGRRAASHTPREALCDALCLGHGNCVRAGIGSLGRRDGEPPRAVSEHGVTVDEST